MRIGSGTQNEGRLPLLLWLGGIRKGGECKAKRTHDNLHIYGSSRDRLRLLRGPGEDQKANVRHDWDRAGSQTEICEIFGQCLLH